MLNNVCTVARPYLFLTLLPLSNSAGMSERLGRDTARTADPNCPKGYSIPFNVNVGNKLGWKEKEMGVVFQGGCYSDTGQALLCWRWW